MNFLEQVIAEWFSHKGYFVKTNIKFGKLPSGGFAGEVDVVAFHPQTRELVHIEASTDGGAKRFKKSLTWRNGTTVSYLSSLMTTCGAWLLAVLRTLRHPGTRRYWGRR